MRDKEETSEEEIGGRRGGHGKRVVRKSTRGGRGNELTTAHLQVLTVVRTLLYILLLYIIFNIIFNILQFIGCK